MKARKGFTLIELLVVIAIIGLLATIAFIALNSPRQKARDSKRAADMKQLRTALELYFNTKGAYPPESVIGDGEVGNPNNGAGCLGDLGWETDTSCAAPIYMGLTPRDPSNTVTNPGNNRPCETTALACNYSYDQINVGTGTNNGYEIHFRLERGTGGLDAGVGCATEAGVGANCSH